MADANVVPQIRFKGFTDPWEQRKLGELYRQGDEKNDRLEFGVDRTISVSTMIWNPGGNGAAAESLPLYKVLREGDLAFEGNRTKGHPYGKLVINDIGAGIMSSRFRTLAARNEVCVTFWKQFLAVDSIFRSVYINCTKRGTLMTELVVPELLDSVIPMPSLPEQRAIGALFSRLDSLITLHQRKCDKLSAVKKALLEKMFPKEGEMVPEIRFKGFTDPWEQRKLGELCTFAKGSGYGKSDIRESGTPLILYGRLYTQYQSRIDEVETFAEPRPGALFSKGCEVVVPASGETAEDIAIASSVRRSGIIFGGDLNVVVPCRELDPDYVALGITYGPAHADLAKRAQGKSVVHIHASDIAEAILPYPGIDEQCALARLTLNLDSLITLHQRELETLKNVKKALLEKMFV